MEKSNFIFSGLLTLMFTVVLIDPMGLLNVKYVSLMVILSLMIIINSPICFTYMNLAISFILIILSFAFVLKQEILYYFDDSMNIIFTTLLLAGIFILNRSQKCIKSFVVACKVILLVNLGFVYMALQHIDIALGVNIALKQYKMFSLEQRGHLFSDYTFYHNSIYITVLLLPLLIKEIKTAKELNWRVLVNILCLLSLLLSQSRTIYFAFVIYFMLNYPRGGICIVTSLVIYVILFDLKLDDSSLTKINYLDSFWLQFSDFKSVVVGTGPLSVDWGANIGEHAFIEHLHRIIAVLWSYWLWSIDIHSVVICLSTYEKSIKCKSGSRGLSVSIDTGDQSIHMGYNGASNAIIVSFERLQ